MLISIIDCTTSEEREEAIKSSEGWGGVVLIHTETDEYSSSIHLYEAYQDGRRIFEGDEGADLLTGFLWDICRL